jgi:hypothetical protein
LFAEFTVRRGNLGMPKTNIFQGNELIKKAIDEVLFPERKVGNDDMLMSDGYPFATESIYFPAFFYMTKKYGTGKTYDEYKVAAEWVVKKKEFDILVEINSCFVEFMIFGPARYYRNHSAMTPARVRESREYRRKKDIILPIYREPGELLTKKTAGIFRYLWSEFKTEQGIKYEKTEYSDGIVQAWIDRINAYNDSVIGVSHAEYADKYGYEYCNRHTRRALKVFRKFLKELLQPIRVRDCEFNIKGSVL